MRGLWIAVLALFSCAALHTEESSVPILTVCQALRGASRYNGQTVIVVGRAAGTLEGSWLGEDCGLALKFADRTFAAAISTAYDASETAAPPALPKGFKWDKRAIDRALAEVQSTSHLQGKAYWCAMFGRLEVNPVRRIDLGDGRFAETIGYGNEGGAAAQLVSPSNGLLRLNGK